MVILKLKGKEIELEQATDNFCNFCLETKPTVVGAFIPKYDKPETESKWVIENYRLKFHAFSAAEYVVVGTPEFKQVITGWKNEELPQHRADICKDCAKQIAKLLE